MDSTSVKDYLKENLMYISIVFFAIFILYVFFVIDFFSIFLIFLNFLEANGQFLDNFAHFLDNGG